MGEGQMSSLQLFLKQTNDDKKRAYWSNFESRPHRSVTILLAQTKQLSELRNEGTSKLQRRLEHGLQIINSHAVVGDVFVQNQGQPAAFAWGTLRLLLRLGAADLDACQDLASNIIEIVHQLAYAEDGLELFPTNVALFDVVADLFASILRYLVQARFYLKAKRPLRAVKAASGGTGKLQKMIVDINHLSTRFDRVFRNAEATAKQRSCQVDKVQAFLKRHTSEILSKPQSNMPDSRAFDWLPDSAEFKSWRACGYNDILFVEGPTGSGKTFLAERILRKADSLLGTKLAISYCFHNHPASVSFVATVLAKLLTIATSLKPTVQWHERVVDEALQLTEHIPCNTTYALELLPKVLEDIFWKEELPEFGIIVDAFSECEAPGATRLFDHLHKLSLSPKVRLVVLSRSDLRITSTRRLKLDYSRLEHDIRAYVEARIASTKQLQYNSSKILDTLPQLCPGLFLSVERMLDDLEHAHTFNEQFKILDQAPKSLDAMYEDLWLRETPDRPESRFLRLKIFSVLVAAREPLSVDDVSSFIALDASTNETQLTRKLYDPIRSVQELCRSFVTLTERRVEIRHHSMKDFLKRYVGTQEDPDAYLAEKCLILLSQESFASVPHAGALMRKHLLPQGLPIGMDDDAVPYQYAALHWWEHVTAVPKPSNTLLSKLSDFISGIPAVTWSERLADILVSSQAAATLNFQIDVRTALISWVRTLPPATGQRVPLDNFFVTSYDRIRHQLAEDEGDHLLPYLPAIRLGQWYNIAGLSGEDFQKAYNYKKIVVDGFTKWLGKQSPLTLQARTEWVKDFFFPGLIEEAETELLEIVQIEREIAGELSDTYFKALQLLGSVQLFLTKLDEALASLKESGTGLLKLFGTEQWIYQVNDLTEGWVLERRGDIEEALKKYESILKQWVPIAGEKNGLSIMAITSIGSVKRKQHQYEEAKSRLLDSWRMRRRQFTINSNTTVDSGLQLALTYRESAAYDDALKLLKQVQESEVFETDFERTCQVAHIRAVVAFEQGEFDGPKNDLHRIIDQTIGDERDKNNRECLWIRTTLADVLRYHGDDAEAPMLFSQLVRPLNLRLDDKPSPLTLEDEPEPPSQLKIAEQAVRLIKDRDQSGAADLLKKNGLEWVRTKDFWIRQGGPPTDTAWMKPVSFSKLLSCSAV